LGDFTAATFTIGDGAAMQCGDQQLSVSLAFDRERHCDAERAIR